MKLNKQINVFVIIIPIVMACCVVAVGTVIINRVVYQLNHKVLLQEITVVTKAIETKRQVLINAGVQHLPNYISAAKQDLLNKITTGDFDVSGKLFILSADKKIIFPYQERKQHPFDQFPSAFFNDPEGAARTQSQNTWYFNVFKSSPSFNWIVGQTIEERKLFTERNRYFRIVVLVTLIILVVSLGASSFYWRLVTGAITAFQDCVVQIGKGNLSARINIRTPSDELSLLKNGINTMAGNLKERNSLLLESEEKYRELVENANSVILRMDSEGNVTFFNEFAQHFFGFSEDEILGCNTVGTIVPEMETSGRDLKALIRDITKKTDRYAYSENENMCKDGKRVWVAWTNKAIFDNDGRVSEILCVGTDITERKQAENLLRESEDRFRAMAEASTDLIITSNADGVIKYCNKAITKMFGYELQEVLG